MAEKPKRIQRKRTKGWRMPPNTVYVGRPTKWANRSRVVREHGGWWVQKPNRLYLYFGPYKRQAYQKAVDLFRHFDIQNLPDLSELRGRDLACWCPLDQPCHADALLELANKPVERKEH